MKDLNSTIVVDKFHLQFKDDWFNYGDILQWSGCEAKIIKTYRKTWWRRLLRSIGFDIRINSCGNVYYKVKLLKDGK